MKINEILITESDKQFKVFNTLQPKISSWIENGVDRWHFIYLNDDPRLCIHMAGFSNNYAPKVLNFSAALNAIKRKHYADLLLLVTYYGHMDNETLVNKINTPKIPIDALTNLLFNEISNGYLAYAHQLEQIYSTLTGASAQESNRFRKLWNKKNQETISSANQIPYDRHKTFAQYINENAFYTEGPFFLNANFRQAKLLYESILN
jgi:hypothetical protein